MIKLVVGVFIVLHGLVHLLYFGQSRRFFALQPDMVWPDGSWAFSHLVGQEAGRWLAGTACVLAAAGFLVGGLAILLGQAWWRPVVVAAALFSAVLFVLFWDGGWHKLADQGLVALLINAAIVVTVLVLHWPDFGF
jgi:hypothetical protein